MENKTLFVDVIIPLAIPNLLTYRVPRELNEFVGSGRRVVVQLGKHKLYTAIIRKVHNRAPTHYTAKYLEAILDEDAVVNERQLKLWEWMSAYYMCHMGEVMAAALPSSLKLASETKVVLNDGWDGDLDALSEKEYLVVQALQVQEVLTLQEIGELVQVKGVQAFVKGLFDKEVVLTEEELADLYRPRMVEFVKLHPSVYSDDALQQVFDNLEKRAPKQLEMLMAFFHLSGNLPHAEREVRKLALQKHIGAQAGLTQKLVEKEVFVLEKRKEGRLLDADEATQEVELSPGQMACKEEIVAHWKEKDVVLLHGVTGSGKTEIYVELIQEILKRKEQVLFLLPEIALTTQIISRLKKIFGARVGVYHSKFNQNERVEIWRDVMKHKPGKYDIVLGARSAALLPFKKLGLVIVDEEHESSYKQYDPAPRYNARDLALVLSKFHGAKTLLGSATPSVESYWNTKQGNYGLVTLTKRYSDVRMPEILCADIRKDLRNKSMRGVFTTFLIEHIKEVLDAGEQIILFQNRRGYAPLWRCEICSTIPQCKRCDVSLTYHKAIHQLKCHYCGYSKTPPNVCSYCGSNELKMLGLGTEKIEEEIVQFFPDAKVQRMDLDTTRSKNAYQRIIGDFERGEIDILVGTQMVTKGLDFDHVSLVGILNADQMIHFPDFRSFERAYQLMVQVAGRAGRKKKRGKVIIQTYNPEHWIFPLVMEGDYQGIFRHEEVERKSFLYPPFFRLIRVTLKHRDLQTVLHASDNFATLLREPLGPRVVGPETPYVGRIRNQYLRTLLIKIERDTNPALVKNILKDKTDDLKAMSEFKGVRIVLDVDPL